MSQFKEQLQEALHAAVKHFNAGLQPSAAVVKAAQDRDFNVDQTLRLTETFNTARTIYHFKTAQDRTQQFALADAGEILPALFGQQAKQASETRQDIPSYGDYEIREADFSQELNVKQAGCNDLELNTPREAVYSMDTLAGRAMQMVRVNRDLADTCRHEASIYGTKAAQCISSLARGISLGYEEEVNDRYSRLLATCQDIEAKPAIDALRDFMPKNASVTPCRDAVVEGRDIEQYRQLVKESCGYLQIKAEMLAVADQLEKEAVAFEQEFMDAADLVQQPVKEAAGDLDSFFPYRLKQAADEPKAKEPRAPTGVDWSQFPLGPRSIFEGMSGAKPMIESVGTGIGKMLDDYSEDSNKKMSDRLRNTRRQIMLEELMATDPVLRDEDPNTVANAYQALMHISPEAAMNKEVVRSVLRASTQSVAVSPYDAKQWADLEKTLGEVTGKLPPRAAAPIQAMPGKRG